MGEMQGARRNDILAEKTPGGCGEHTLWEGGNESEKGCQMEPFCGNVAAFQFLQTAECVPILEAAFPHAAVRVSRSSWLFVTGKLSSSESIAGLGLFHNGEYVASPCGEALCLCFPVT